jgi:hypothetical protein
LFHLRCLFIAGSELEIENYAIAAPNAHQREKVEVLDWLNPCGV